jgi:hypothetical protein
LSCIAFLQGLLCNGYREGVLKKSSAARVAKPDVEPAYPAISPTSRTAIETHWQFKRSTTSAAMRVLLKLRARFNGFHRFKKMALTVVALCNCSVIVARVLYEI